MLASAYTQKSFSAKLLTPKYGGSFILVSLISRGHQVNLIILLLPVFFSLVYDETWWSIFNVNLSYKPPSYCSIIFWYLVHPRHFTWPKTFRSLVLPSKGWREGFVIQGRKLNCRISCGMPVVLDKKGGKMGSSFHAPRKSNSMYLQAFILSIYDTRWPKHLHSSIY